MANISESYLIDFSELELNENVGRGSFGTVFKGKWMSQEVAIKTMIGGITNDDFIMEALTMVILKHPNIVELFGLSIHNETSYIVMAYMDLGSVRDYVIKSKNKLSNESFLDISRQVCKGMNYLASNNIIHRDLAARNCLINSSKTVKVCDFGLARIIFETSAHYTNNKFNPLWLAPEVQEKSKYSTKSDVWAFGVLMWEVFSYGEIPYQKLVGGLFSVPEYVKRRKILNRPDNCSKTIYEIMKKCWSFRPKCRPSFSELEQDLHEKSQYEKLVSVSNAQEIVQMMGTFLIDYHELKLIGKVGKGSFGEVWNGKWMSQEVAIKTMMGSTMDLKEFMNEALTMVVLKHPNIIELFGLSIHNEMLYIVMGFMDLGSVERYLIKNKNKLSNDFLLDICKQVCKGMNYLASNNIIHRDLAARNCLINSSKTVKICDFGLARIISENSASYTNNELNPLWLAPEVMKKSRYSTKSDVWAFGVLMWEVFSYGEIPYLKLMKFCEVPEYVMQGNILNQPVTCSRNIYDIMRNCWTFTPEDRSSFSRLQQDLKASLSAIWVKSSRGNTPKTAFNPIPNISNQQIYVIRAPYKYAMLPGKLPVPLHTTAYVSYNELEIAAKNYEVLCNFVGRWVKCPKKKIPSNALPGGYENKETLYIGKVTHNREVCIGKVQPSNMFCYIPWGGREYVYGSFEILVKEIE